MRTTIAPYQTPAEIDDDSQPREQAVNCAAHHLPTWRSDAYCARCLAQHTTLRIYCVEAAS